MRLLDFENISLSTVDTPVTLLGPTKVATILHPCYALTDNELFIMVSFRFLNPRLVDEYPQYMDDACYKGLGDEPEILCSDIPPNQFRFLGWW